MTSEAEHPSGPTWPRSGHDEGGYRARATSGAKWGFLSFLGGQGLRALVALVLARILGPEEFGVAAQALIYVTFVAMVLDQGLAATLVQRRFLEPSVVGSAVWMTVALATSMGLITFLASGIVADFFRTPELGDVLKVLSVTVVFQGLKVVPQGLLVRALRIKGIAIRELGASFVGGAVGIGAALSGAGYWAVVGQALVADFLVLVASLLMVGRMPLRGSVGDARSILRFSLPVFGTQVLNYGSRSVDNVLIGRYLGPADLALYSVAYRTMLLPVQAFAHSANQITLPVYSRLQDDRARLRAAFLEVSQTLALATFPLMALFALWAPIAIPGLLGAAWEPAVAPFQALAFTGLRQGVTSSFGTVFIACGKPGLGVRFQIINLAILVPAFAVGLLGGVLGVAIAYGVGGFVTSPIALVMVNRLTGGTVVSFLREMVPPAGATVSLVAAFLAVESAVPTGEVLGACIATCLSCLIALAVYRGLWPSDFSRSLGRVRAILGR